MYDEGNGVKQDYSKAVKYYQEATDQSYARAQSNLGALYYSGNGVKQDETKAYRYWMKAAKQGNANAKNNLNTLCKLSPWICKK